MWRLPGDVRAFGSMRLCLREIWRTWQIEETKNSSNRCGFGSGNGSDMTPLLFFDSVMTAVPIPVETAANTSATMAAVMAAVDDGDAWRSRFSEWSSSTWFRKRVANCNLNRSQSQACVESGNIHGRGNRLFLEVRIGKGFLLERRLVLNRK